MGVFDFLKKEGQSAADAATWAKAEPTPQNETKSFVFSALPKTLAELRAFPEASLQSPYQTAALTVAALCRYGEDREAVYEMLNFLKGPEPLSNYEKQFLNDRLAGKLYKPFSFFDGATPGNGYAPAAPCRITVSSTPYSFSTENWATLYVRSSGADAPRPIKLRKKPSTGQWFLNEIQCLSDIRVPEAEDPWA